MPGFFVWDDAVPADAGPNQIGPYDVITGANTQALALYRGDPLVWTTVQSSSSRLRKVVQDDIDDLWQVSAANVGFLGISPQNVASDSNGNYTTVPSTLNLAGNVANVYPVPTMAAYNTPDLNSGLVRSSVIDLQNVIGGALWENTTINDGIIGTMVGMLISTISGQPPTFFWSSAATTKIARIVAIDDQSPYFNQTVTANVSNTTHNNRCPIAVRVLATYDQYLVGGNYED